MKKILLTLLIYIAYCIFVQCENDKLQESLVIATILSSSGIVFKEEVSSFSSFVQANKESKKIQFEKMIFFFMIFVF